MKGASLKTADRQRSTEDGYPLVADYWLLNTKIHPLTDALPL